MRSHIVPYRSRVQNRLQCRRTLDGDTSETCQHVPVCNTYQQAGKVRCCSVLTKDTPWIHMSVRSGLHCDVGCLHKKRVGILILEIPSWNALQCMMSARKRVGVSFPDSTGSLLCLSCTCFSLCRRCQRLCAYRPSTQLSRLASITLTPLHTMGPQSQKR